MINALVYIVFYFIVKLNNQLPKFWYNGDNEIFHLFIEDGLDRDAEDFIDSNFH